MKKKPKKKKHTSPYWIVFPGYIAGYEKNVIKRPSTIAWCKACNHRVYICFKDRKYMKVSVCLKFMEEQLILAVFFRTGKFYIVNMRMVESYCKYKRGYMLTIKNLLGDEAGDIEIPVSELLKADFEEKVKLFPAIMQL
jgi:DNA-binding LytR/AlgR family response regulator